MSATAESGMEAGSSVALSRGLQLVRASTMASTRLQLALARRDRRQAMAALDGLIDIDAEIERFVAELPRSQVHPDWMAIADRLAQQKAAIASEKFTLACEISGPGLISPPGPLSARPAPRLEKEPEPVTKEFAMEPEEEGSRPYLKWLAALLVVAMGAIGVVAYYYLR